MLTVLQTATCLWKKKLKQVIILLTPDMKKTKAVKDLEAEN